MGMADSFLIFALVLTSLGALSDFRSLRIPNAIPFGIILSFIASAAVSGMSLVTVASHVGVAAVVLMAAFGLFAARLLGGGDGKLLAALSLWAGPELALTLILNTALIGGAFAFSALVLNKLPLPVWAYSIGWIAAPGEKLRSIPYGVAIALGALSTFWSRFL